MINDKNFDQNLIKKIKEKKIAPTPKWKFIFKNYVIWIIGALCLLIGAISVSLTVHMLRNNDLGMYRKINHVRPLEFFLLFIPLFWLILLVIFITFVYYDIKHTKKGYRYSTTKILLITIFISATLGIGFYYFGLGQKIDDVLGERAPFYDRIINPRIHFWSNPDDGRLSGMVISKNEEKNFTLIDSEREEWEVLMENAWTNHASDMKEGQPIHLLGKKIAPHQFKANEILPMRSGRGFFNQFNKRPPFPNNGQHKINKLIPPPKCINNINTFSAILEKYPNLKKAFTQDILEYKEQLQEDAELINYFEALRLDANIINQLKK